MASSGRSKRRRLAPAAVDLFCGAGGLSYGMQQAGIHICAGIDIDPACRHPFETNVKAAFHEADAVGLSPEFVESLFPDGAPRVLAGCAPCQPFSSYNRTQQDGWGPLSKFGELVYRLRPAVVTMENVPGLERYPVFKKYVQTLKRAGYRHIWHRAVWCMEYGVPQTRRRLVLLASRLGDISLEPPTHRSGKFVTVRDVIRHTKPIRAGGESASDRLHRSSSLSDLNMRRIRASVPGGSWRDWRPSLRAACHNRETGRSYSNVYGRMVWDEPAPTITTEFFGFGNGRFGHPEQDRAISLREGAMLQTFPPDYSFVPDGDDVYMNRIGRLIGNAVPVSLGAAIGRSIASHMRSHNVG